MSVTRLATRYAKSLFDLAKADNLLDKIRQDVNYIEEVSKVGDFQNFLRNPIISTQKKEEVFKAVFGTKVQALTLKTLSVIAEHKRERYLGNICHSFQELYNKELKISIVTLTTAEKISDQAIKNILESFKAAGFIHAQIQLEIKVDPSLVGGFILKFDDQVYDASLSRQIEQMQTKFTENLYIKNL